MWQQKSEAGSQRFAGEVASLGGELDSLHQHVGQMGVKLEDRAALVAYNEAQEVCCNSLLHCSNTFCRLVSHPSWTQKLPCMSVLQSNALHASMDLAPLKGESSGPECLSYMLMCAMLCHCMKTCQLGQA